MRRIGYIPVILLFCLAPTGNAQDKEVLRDLRLWTGAKIEKDFGKDWRLSLEQEFRFKENISKINNIFTEAELRYRINRNFYLNAGFRYTSDRNDDGSYDGLARNHFSLQYRGRLEFVTFEYRLKYQREVEAARFFTRDSPYEKIFRNRLGVRVTRLDRIQPYVSGEILQVFTPYLSSLNDFWRFVMGVRMEPGNIGEFKLGWGFNREIGVDQPAMIYMIRMNYTYSL
jgi:hypothetical protein